MYYLDKKISGTHHRFHP